VCEGCQLHFRRFRKLAFLHHIAAPLTTSTTNSALVNDITILLGIP
jgi:hypothetical protein